MNSFYNLPKCSILSCVIPEIAKCSKSPTYELSSCELSKMQTWIRSMSYVSETATCIPSTITHDTSALWSEGGNLLSLLQSVTLLDFSFNPSSCMPATVLYFPRCCTVRSKNVFPTFCVFLCITCVKCIINLLRYSTIIVNCVSGIPRLTLLDVGTNWTYQHTLGRELIPVSPCRWLTVVYSVNTTKICHCEIYIQIRETGKKLLLLLLSGFSRVRLCATP